MILAFGMAARRLDRDQRVEDGPGLDLHEVRDHQAEAAAAQPEHRVLLVQALDRREQDACPPRSRRRRSARVTLTSCSSRFGRNSWSGGSMSRMTTGRPSIARKMPSKSPCWRTSSLAIAASKVGDGLGFVGVERLAGGAPWPWPASRRSRRGSRRARSRAARPRGTCARCGTGRCPARRSSAPCAASSGLSALVQTCIRRISSAQPRIVWSSGWSSNRAETVGSAPTKTSPVEPSTLIQSPSANVDAVGGARVLRAVVDDELVRSRPRTACRSGGRRPRRAGRAAAGGQDALGHGHAVEVVGRGLDRGRARPARRGRPTRPRCRHRRRRARRPRPARR